MSDTPLNGRSKEFVWYQRFGYPNEKSLHTLASQQLVDDFDLSKYKSYTWKGNYTKPHFQVKAEHELQYLLTWFIAMYVDQRVLKSLSGARYFVTLGDDNTHTMCGYTF